MQSRNRSGRFFRDVVRNLAIASVVTTLGGYAAATQAAVGTGSSMQWPVWGGSTLNKGYATNETKLSPTTVPNLKVKWIFNTNGSVASTPTVDGSYLYATDLKGYVYKINRSTGKQVWSKNLTSFTGNFSSLSRNSPAITSNAVIIGDQATENVIALSKTTGAKLWMKSLKLEGSGHITNSPMVYNGVVYVGVASFEEGSDILTPIAGPTFRGSVWALNAGTGKEVWHTMMTPEGYTGVGVWSSPMAIDTGRGLLYLTTGDNYTVPDAVAACLNALGPNPDFTDPNTLDRQLTCIAPDDYVDSVVAISLTTGSVKWARRLQGADAWNAFCLTGISANCEFSGVDWDFGSGPNLVDATIGGKVQRLVGAGEKNGIYWALDPDTGATVWSKLAGPPSLEGGIEWGTATDDKRVYIAEANFPGTTYTLANGTSWDAGSWAALDAATGTIIWQTPAPADTGAHGETTSGAISVANGVMYTGTLGGRFVALNANTGAILWSYESGGSVICAPSIVDGVLYWGSGYGHIGTPNTQLYALTVP